MLRLMYIYTRKFASIFAELTNELPATLEVGVS